MTAKLPSIQWYPGDWRKDPGVQSLSFHDRGVWFEMLMLMHESEPRGYLMLNGRPIPEDNLARLLGLVNQNPTTGVNQNPTTTLRDTLTTLLNLGIASKDEKTGAIFCRRMVRDEKIRQIRTEAGKKGGNPNLVHKKDEILVNQNPTTGVNQNPTPSSSSSTSVLKNKETALEKEPDFHPDFLKFWDSYPKTKRGNQKAIFKLWKKEGSTRSQELLKALKNHVAQAKETKFVKTMKNFLNDDWPQWLEKPEPQAAKATRLKNTFED